MAPTSDTNSYGYLFEPNKQPTKLLSALLGAIALYICENIGEVDQKCLRPEKMAAFYKAVGGNYDSLFVNVPPTSISWIYASIGCEHILLPTEDHFIPPSIPSLTIAGFVRWQSIEILLGPEEHVPFIQASLRQFDLRHPETNKPFPEDLPAVAFPLVPDPEIERWHESCAQQLRLRATALENENKRFQAKQNPQPSFTHVHPKPQTWSETENFDRTHASNRSSWARDSSPGNRPIKTSSNPEYRSRSYVAAEELRAAEMRGRKSNPDLRSPSPHFDPGRHEIIVEEEPVRPRRTKLDHLRRHTLPPRQYRRSISSDLSSDNDVVSSDENVTKTKTYHNRPAYRGDLSDRFSPKIHVQDKDTKTAHDEHRSRARAREPVPAPDETRHRSIHIPGMFPEKKDHRSCSRNHGQGGGNVRWQELEGTATLTPRDGGEGWKAERYKRGAARQNPDRGNRRDWDWDVRLWPRENKQQISHEEMARRERYRDLLKEGRGLNYREKDTSRRYLYHADLRRRSPIRGVGAAHY